jgi:hypothetical protein
MTEGDGNDSGQGMTGSDVKLSVFLAVNLVVFKIFKT